MNYRELTKQQLFDITWNGAKSTGFTKSADDDGSCFYFSPDGNRCAAGWHIPNDKFIMQQNSMFASEVTFFNQNFDEWQIEFICDLQGCHDNAEDAAEYASNLRTFAVNRDLSIPA